jgi:Cu2+-exporting ATPase
MNVLVSLGVLVAYLFSAFATHFAPRVETSFDAAAMLVSYVLFGHWMEMRSRWAPPTRSTPSCASRPPRRA